MSSRRLANLIKRLPPSSRLSRELNGESAEWSRTDQLLALVADRLAILDWHFMCANSEEGKAPDPPDMVPRPWVELESPEDTSASPSEIAGFFSA